MDFAERSLRLYGKTYQVGPEHIDENGHVNNVVYVHWMQDIAQEHSAALGWTSERYFEFGATWVARQHTIDYLHQAFLNDEIRAETWVSEMRHVSSVRCYKFTRVSDGALLASAQTRWGFISIKTGQIVRILPEVEEVFKKIQIVDES